MSDVNDLTKLIFDDKAFSIMKSTSEESKTVKQLAKEMSIPASNLYYTINKLVDIEALKITGQTQVRNMIENAYSSSHLFEQEIVISKEWLKDNFDIFLQYYLLNQKRMLDQLSDDMANEESIEDNVKIIFLSARLSEKNWDNLQGIIDTFIEQHSSSNTNDKSINMIIAAEKL